MSKRVAFIIAPEKFREEEYFKPKEFLEKNGVKIITASTKTGTIKGKQEKETQSTLLLKDLKPEEFDAVAFIGGPGSHQYFNDPVAHQIAQRTISSGKILGSICAAGVILANAGTLKGKKATVFPASENIEALKNNGANYTQANVEVDGKIITADGPASAQAFGKKILELI